MLAALLLALVVLPVAAMAVNEQDLINTFTNGGSIKLTANIVLTNGLAVPAGKTVKLDLNGYQISQTKAQTVGYQMIANDGNLTIEDSVGTGRITYVDSGDGGEYISDTIYNRGTLVIDGGTIENLSSSIVASNGYPHAVDTYSGNRNTSVTINGGTIYCKEYSAIRMFCVSATNKADLIINGGVIKGAIDMQNGTRLSALGTLTINGGEFETTKNANNIRFANWNGNAEEYGITATIKDGDFEGGITTAYVPKKADFNKEIISGGTFEVDPSEYVAASASAAEVTSGSEKVYTIGTASTQEAINTAVADGKSVTVTVTEGSMTLTNVPAGVKITNKGDGKVSANGMSIAKGEGYTIPFPVASDLPQTGDNSHLALYAALLTLCGAGLTMLKKRSMSR